MALAVPAIPASSCPSAAAALGAGGLGPVCQAASGVSGLAGSAASQLAGAGVDSVLNGLGTWVADGATWLLGQIGGVMGATTGVDLGASWFGAHYETMAALGAVVIVPLLLLGVMQALYRQNASMLVRSALVHVPLAILLTAVAVKLVQLGLAVTDAMSAAVAQGAGLDGGHFLGSVTDALSGPAAVGSGGAPAFVLFLGALAVVFGAVMVWIELLLRSAAVYVAVLFLPLALASLAWPAIAHWCRRLVDTLVALILGKFVIVAVLSLSAGALAGGTGSAPSGTGGVGDPTGASGGGGFGAVLGGAALLLLAAFSPWALFRLLPFVETGAVGHLEAVGRRAHQSVATPVGGLAQVAMRASVAGGAAGLAAGEVGSLVGAGTRTAGSGGGVFGSRRATADATATATAGRARPGPSGDRPDPGPSSVETTGVGTTEPPGHAIPSWDVHPAATAAARHYLEHGSDPRARPSDGPLPPGAAAQHRAGSPAASAHLDPQAPSAVVRLPRQSGTLVAEGLGRDELGPRLVVRRELPPPPPPDGRG